MKFCIMATDENVAAVRAAAHEKIPELAGHSLLNYPLSPTGEEPPTHWFCTLEASGEMLEKLEAARSLSVMERVGAPAFLAKHDLKIVRRN